MVAADNPSQVDPATACLAPETVVEPRSPGTPEAVVRRLVFETPEISAAPTTPKVAPQCMAACPTPKLEPSESDLADDSALATDAAACSAADDFDAAAACPAASDDEYPKGADLEVRLAWLAAHPDKGRELIEAGLEANERAALHRRCDRGNLHMEGAGRFVSRSQKNDRLWAYVQQRYSVAQHRVEKVHDVLTRAKGAWYTDHEMETRFGAANAAHFMTKFEKRAHPNCPAVIQWRVLDDLFSSSSGRRETHAVSAEQAVTQAEAEDGREWLRRPGEVAACSLPAPDECPGLVILPRGAAKADAKKRARAAGSAACPEPAAKKKAAACPEDPAVEAAKAYDVMSKLVEKKSPKGPLKGMVDQKWERMSALCLKEPPTTRDITEIRKLQGELNALLGKKR